MRNIPPDKNYPNSYCGDQTSPTSLFSLLDFFIPNIADSRNVFVLYCFHNYRFVLLLINHRSETPNIMTTNQNPTRRSARSYDVGDSADTLHHTSTVARMKLHKPQPTFIRGLESLPNGVLNIFPAEPNKKCGMPLPSKNPIKRYQREMYIMIYARLPHLSQSFNVLELSNFSVPFIRFPSMTI